MLTVSFLYVNPGASGTPPIEKHIMSLAVVNQIRISCITKDALTIDVCKLDAGVEGTQA